MVPLSHYLILSAVVFAIGVIGVLIRRNLIVILMSIELMLNAVNLTFIAFSRFSVRVTARWWSSSSWRWRLRRR